MAQVINTNVMSLNAQRNLSTSGGRSRPHCSACLRACASTAPRTTRPASRSASASRPRSAASTRPCATPATASRCRRRPKAPSARSATTCSACASWRCSRPTRPTAPATVPRCSRKCRSCRQKSTASPPRRSSTARTCSTARFSGAAVPGRCQRQPDDHDLLDQQRPHQCARPVPGLPADQPVDRHGLGHRRCPERDGRWRDDLARLDRQ